MTQPKFSPILEGDEVRDALRSAPPDAWVPHRPSEFRRGTEAGHSFGVAGPDQGYALYLAERFEDRLELEVGEHAEDVLAGAVAIALRRAALFGRAPIGTDVALSLELFGYLPTGGDQSVPRDLIELRRALFAGVAHEYWRLDELARSVPEAALRLDPAEVAGPRDHERDGWRRLLEV